MKPLPPAAVDPRLETTLCGLTLATPVLTASGTCGYGPEYADLMDYRRLGGFTTKAVTPLPRSGNEPQRIVETPGGLLNAIGLANVGLERFIAEKLPFIRTMPTRVFVNVAGHSAADYLAVVEALDGFPELAGFELNVSCPNVADGLMFGTDPVRLRALVAAVRRVCKRGKLIVKLSPNVTDVVLLARAAIDGGADMLSLINTYVALAIDIQTRRPLLSNNVGGYSGPAVKPLALFNVHRVYQGVAQAAGVPLIGMGGIQNVNDAIEFFLVGASAVAVGTALFVDPAAPVKIADELSAYLATNGIQRVSDLVGTVRVN